MDRDVYVMGLVRAIGLDELPILTGESPQQYAVRLLSHLLQREEVFRLMGGLILPEELEDLAWSRAVGAETAAFLAGLTEPADKAAVTDILIGVLVPFLQSGLVSLTRSAASSSPI